MPLSLLLRVTLSGWKDQVQRLTPLLPNRPRRAPYPAAPRTRRTRRRHAHDDELRYAVAPLDRELALRIEVDQDGLDLTSIVAVDQAGALTSDTPCLIASPLRGSTNPAYPLGMATAMPHGTSLRSKGFKMSSQVARRSTPHRRRRRTQVRAGRGQSAAKESKRALSTQSLQCGSELLDVRKSLYTLAKRT